MVRRRGDNIPNIKDYAHWNEDAYYMWYEENKYDMMYADEIIEDDDDYRPDYEQEYKYYKDFDNEKEAREFFETRGEATLHNWGTKWVVEYD